MRYCFLLTLIWSATLAAANPWQESFSGGGDLLYWKPSPCPFRLVEQYDTEGQIDAVSMMPNSAWGFRLRVGYECLYFFGEANYLWLESSDRLTLHRPPEAILLVPALDFDLWEQAAPHLLFHYQQVDVRMGQTIYRDNCWTLRALINARWTDIVRRLQVIALNEDAHAHYNMKSEFDGAGIGIGLRCIRTLWCGLSATAEMGTTALIGERKLSTWKILDPDNDPTLLNLRPVTCAIPNLDLRFGIQGEWSFRNLCLTASLAYEFHQYWHVLKIAEAEVYGPTLTDGRITCQDIAIAGPLFQVALSF